MSDPELVAKKRKLERRLARLRQRAKNYDIMSRGQGVSSWMGQWASKGAQASVDEVKRDPELQGLVWFKETRYRRGKLYLRGGRKAQARKDFARLAADDPHYRDVAELQREPGFARSRADSAREPIPQEVKDRAWRRDEGRCVSCGSQELLEFDHIIPLAMGGSNTERNLQLLCERCNREKAATL